MLNRPVNLIKVMNRGFLHEELERAIRRTVERMMKELAGDISSIIESALESVRPVIRKAAEGEYLIPEYDVYVEGDEVVAVIQLPGASKSSVDLRIADCSLTLEAKFSDALVSSASKSSLFKARGYRCVIELPKEVEPSQGKAIYLDGILVVRLPVRRPRGVKVEIE